MPETNEPLQATAALRHNMDSNIDFAVRVVNDVATTMTAVFEATSNMQDHQAMGVARNLMKSSIGFTSASVSDFLTLSKALLHTESAQEYYDIQRDFFRDRTAATLAHIKYLAEFATSPK